MLKKLINIVIEILKEFFIVITIFSFIAIIVLLFKYNVSTLLYSNYSDSISVGPILIPKVLVIAILFLFGILIVLLAIKIIFQDYFKKPKKKR